MRILALDSSGLTASVAAVEDEQILFEYTMNYKKTHSQTLLPMLDEAVSITGMPLESVDAIAVAGGPGSFTGLRIGSATAKGLGLALDKPLIHVPTVDAMAYRMFGFDGLICPVMDARRNQVYTGIYRFKNDFETVKEQMAEDISVVIEMLNDLGERVVFLGDGVPVYRTQIEEKMQVPYVFAPPHMCRQSAAAVGALGLVYAKEGRMENARDHKPDYLRMSQVERERLEREKEQQHDRP